MDDDWQSSGEGDQVDNAQLANAAPNLDPRSRPKENFGNDFDSGAHKRRNQDSNNNDDRGADEAPRRRRNQDNDNNEGDQNQEGGFRRRRNQDNDNNEGDQNQEGGFRRRRNQDNDNNGGDQNQEGGYRRRRNQDNDNNEGDQNQEGGYRRRRNRDDDNNGGTGDSNETGQRRRRNQDNGNEAQTSETIGEDGKPKENYIPRRYNKEDEDLFEGVGEGINFAKFDNTPVQMSGERLPKPIQRFSEIATHPSVIDAVKKSGYRTLTPIQKYGISVVMNDRDLMASAQTGSGKTIAFLLPIIERLLANPDSKVYEEKPAPQALILTPTRELAIQIYEQAMKLTYKNDLRPCVVYGGTAYGDQKNRISFGANIVVATTGRMLHYLEKEVISLKNIKFFVLDEADRMIDQGFIPAVRRISCEFDMPTERHTMMFSATFPSEVQRLAQEFLKNDYIFLSVGILGSANADVKQEIRQVDFKDKKRELTKIVKEIYKPNERILVFVEKKKSADFLALNFCESDFKSTSIHGDRLQSQREQALNTFKKGETPVLFATSVAARGLDIKGVGYVINYDLPSEIEEYVHRIGRTGRVGNCGTAISFYCEKDDSALAPKLAKLLSEAGQKVPDFLSSYSDGLSSFADDTLDKDTRRGDVDNKADFSSKTDNYQAATTNDADEDW